MMWHGREGENVQPTTELASEAKLNPTVPPHGKASQAWHHARCNQVGLIRGETSMRRSPP
jgi:hypothetical protein